MIWGRASRTWRKEEEEEVAKKGGGGVLYCGFLEGRRGHVTLLVFVSLHRPDAGD